MSQTKLFRTKEGRIIRRAALPTVSLEEQRDALVANKPRMRQVDKFFVVEVYSPFVKKYIVSEEWPDKVRATAGLKAEMKAHQRLVATLEEAVKTGPAASFKKAESGDAAAYKAYFEKKLKEWNIKSPVDLDDAKKKKFFSEVDDGWTSDDEKKGSPPPDADATCGCGCSGGTRKAAAATLATAKALVKKFAQGLETEVDSNIISIFYNLDTRNKAKKAAGAISKALGGVTTRDNGSHIMIYYKKSPPDMGDWNDPSSRHHY